MPSTVLIFNTIGIIFQYSLVALIYYFLFKVLKFIYLDFKAPITASTPIKINSLQGMLVVEDNGYLELAKTSYILGETTTIGRGENNDIVIDDNFISHQHACITKYNECYWLKDLHSTNKTFLNGQPVLRDEVLNPGDIIKIGAVIFRFKG